MYGAVQAIVIFELKICIAELQSKGEAHGQGIDTSEEVSTCDRLPSLEAWIGFVYGVVQAMVIFAPYKRITILWRNREASRCDTCYNRSMAF